MRKLNLGSGNDTKIGWVNLDKTDYPGTNVIHDLNNYPYPFNDDTFDEVYGKGIIMYLDINKTMKEIKRICKNRAKVTLIEPCFPCFTSNQDPNVITFLTWNTMTYFDFKQIRQSFIFSPNKKFNWISHIINLSPKFYMRFFFNVLPSHFIKYELEVVK